MRCSLTCISRSRAFALAGGGSAADFDAAGYPSDRRHGYLLYVLIAELHDRRRPGARAAASEALPHCSRFSPSPKTLPQDMKREYRSPGEVQAARTTAAIIAMNAAQGIHPSSPLAAMVRSVFPPPACGSFKRETSGPVSTLLDQEDVSHQIRGDGTY